MKVLKPLFAFYIDSSIHVAIAVSALVAITEIYLKLELDILFYAFVFLGTITGYNFVKYAKIAGLHHRSLAKSLKAIQIFSAVCALGLVWVSLQMPIKVLLCASGFGIFTFFYAVPVIAGYNLRNVAGIKGFIVAIVWVGITVVLPVVTLKTSFSLEIAMLSLQRFLLVIVWLLPFEIRDLKYDKLALGTFPQRLGINRTKALGVILLLVVLLLEFYFSNSQNWQISAAIIMVLVSTGLIINTRKSQSRYYASFWVESIPVFWLLFLHLLIQLSL